VYIILDACRDGAASCREPNVKLCFPSWNSAELSRWRLTDSLPPSPWITCSSWH